MKKYQEETAVLKERDLLREWGSLDFEMLDFVRGFIPDVSTVKIADLAMLHSAVTMLCARREHAHAVLSIYLPANTQHHNKWICTQCLIEAGKPEGLPVSLNCSLCATGEKHLQVFAQSVEKNPSRRLLVRLTG